MPLSYISLFQIWILSTKPLKVKMAEADTKKMTAGEQDQRAMDDKELKITAYEEEEQELEFSLKKTLNLYDDDDSRLVY